MKQKTIKLGVWVVSFAMAFAALAAFTPASVQADEGIVLRFVVGNTTFSVNGAADTLDAAPFNQDGRVMVPLRQIGEAIGATTIAFEDNTAIIDDIRLPIGVELAGGMGTPVIVEGRTFVPLGYIAAAIGATPRWDGVANAAYIYVGVEAPAVPDAPTPVADPTPVDEATEEVADPTPAPAADGVVLNATFSNASDMNAFEAGQQVSIERVSTRGDGDNYSVRVTNTTGVWQSAGTAGGNMLIFTLDEEIPFGTTVHVSWSTFVPSEGNPGRTDIPRSSLMIDPPEAGRAGYGFQPLDTIDGVGDTSVNTPFDEWERVGGSFEIPWGGADSFAIRWRVNDMHQVPAIWYVDNVVVTVG